MGLDLNVTSDSLRSRQSSAQDGKTRCSDSDEIKRVQLGHDGTERAEMRPMQGQSATQADGNKLNARKSNPQYSV